MRTTLLPSFFLLAAAFVPSLSIAQVQPSAAVTLTASTSTVVEESTTAAPTADSDEAPTRILTGRVVDPAGRVLPGAVVKLAATTQRVVTNANGEFRLTVPATSEPVVLTTSYAGFADETLTVPAVENATTLKLVTPKVIKVARKQQLKKYLKTASRQVKRSKRKA